MWTLKRKNDHHQCLDNVYINFQSIREECFGAFDSTGNILSLPRFWLPGIHCIIILTAVVISFLQPVVCVLFTIKMLLILKIKGEI